jgi:hypothetical protein
MATDIHKTFTLIHSEISSYPTRRSHPTMKSSSAVVICTALLSLVAPAVGMSLNELWLQKRQDAVTHDPADVLTPVSQPTALPAPPVDVGTGTLCKPMDRACANNRYRSWWRFWGLWRQRGRGYPIRWQFGRFSVGGARSNRRACGSA